MSGACSECEGHGYDTFIVNREPWIEIERCNSCGKFDNDDGAAARYVLELQAGDEYATRCMLKMNDSDPAQADVPVPTEETIEGEVKS